MSNEDPKLQHESEPTQSVSPFTRTPGRARGGVPNWAPWAVLSTLVALGMLGGLGLLPLGLLKGGPSSGSASGVPRATASTVALSAPAPSASSKGPSITASHICVTYSGTMLGARQRVARTKEEAKKRAEEALARLRKGEDFVKLVAEYSDEPNAAERKGFIGKFGERHALKPFGAAAFKLAPGEYSDVVETGLGFHIILRHQ